jgi:hypothetical protein
MTTRSSKQVVGAVRAVELSARASMPLEQFDLAMRSLPRQAPYRIAGVLAWRSLGVAETAITSAGAVNCSKTITDKFYETAIGIGRGVTSQGKTCAFSLVRSLGRRPCKHYRSTEKRSRFAVLFEFLCVDHTFLCLKKHVADRAFYAVSLDILTTLSQGARALGGNLQLEYKH